MAKTVLVVEDDPSISNLLKINLSLAGYTPMTADEGEKGIQLFSDHPADLVLLDLMLPGKDGWEVLEAIRKMKRKVPVIILSARTQKTDLAKGAEMGATEYVTKPFDPIGLMEKIKKIIG